MNDNQKTGNQAQPTVHVEQIVMPDICTSLNNCACGDYCKQCSHGLFIHKIRIKNKIYRFEFNQRFGVTFINKDGGVSKIQITNENHPFWIEFQKWYDEKFKV